MRFKTTDQIRIYAKQAQKNTYSLIVGDVEDSADWLQSPEFQGDGGLINYIRVKGPIVASGGNLLCVFLHERDGATTSTVWSGSAPYTDVAYRDVVFNPNYRTDPAKSYWVSVALKIDTIDGAVTINQWNYKLAEDGTTKLFDGEIATIPELRLSEGSAAIGTYQPSGYNEDYPYFDIGALPEGAYMGITEGKGGDKEITAFYVGGYVDLIDAAITSRAPAEVNTKADQIIADLEDPTNGLAAIRAMEDTINDKSQAIIDSVGELPAGEGNIHAKLGPYSGDSGDNNNIKDDIGSLSVVGATVKDVWSYKPDGSEGADSTANLLGRGTDAAEANKALLEGVDGLNALHSDLADIQARIGDTAGEDVITRLSNIMAELISTDHGLAILKSALDAIQEDIGDPSIEGATLLSKLNTALAELQDAAHGLVPIKAGIDDNNTALNGIDAKLGAPTDTVASGTMWGDINGLEDSMASALSKLDDILSRLDSTTYGLSAIKSALDNVIAALGDTATYGTITDQSQAIKTMLEDATYGLSALKGALDYISTVLGTPATVSIAGDIAENLANIQAAIVKIDAIQAEIDAIQAEIGDSQGTDIIARLEVINTGLTDIINSVGTPATGEGTIHEKLGDYDGIRTESGGILISGHRIRDDLEIIKETMLTAQFPGSGAYLNTDSGYYANSQFYAVGTGPVVNPDGVPLAGVRVSAFYDGDGDGIFERLMARAYTDASGKWQMALDTGVYLLTFYLPGSLLAYEWRVVDPDNTGLEPPAEAPSGGHLPNGGDGLI